MLLVHSSFNGHGCKVASHVLKPSHFELFGPFCCHMYLKQMNAPESPVFASLLLRAGCKCQVQGSSQWAVRGMSGMWNRVQGQQSLWCSRDNIIGGSVWFAPVSGRRAETLKVSGLTFSKPVVGENVPERIPLAHPSKDLTQRIQERLLQVRVRGVYFQDSGTFTNCQNICLPSYTKLEAQRELRYCPCYLFESTDVWFLLSKLWTYSLI